ncbi:MAG: PBP1A family penicillin-binding protein [bacterium]
MKKKLFIKIITVFSLFAIAVMAGFSLQILNQLPNVETIASYVPSETTQIFSSDGKVLARLHREENRQVVPLSKISVYMQYALIASEDPSFYRHHGFDLYGIFRASIKNLMYGRFVEGASTITQQLARNLFLTKRKKITRKLAEIVLAMQIEKKYTKEEILELYLNQVYFGHNAYGIESAANLYFGKHAAELNLAESALIAGLIRGPELYSPYHNFKLSKKRQVYVLNKIVEANFVPFEEANQASLFNLEFTPENMKRRGELAPYFVSHILKELIDQYGKEKVYHEGLRVYTTLDPDMQLAAEDIINKFISSEGQRYNFSQAALISIDPRTGYIKAMVGGVDFYESKFNRVTQAKRQPGSAFKPFIYTAAMEQGLSPGTIIMDTATTFEVYPNEWNPDGTWQPMNFNKKFNGPVTLRYAVEKSLNIPAIKILEQVGINSAINVAQRMGIKSHLEPGLALTLGASEVTPLELTSAFGVFANSGIRVEPTAITKIEDRNGKTIYKHSIEEKIAVDKNIAAVMVNLLEGVIKRGTGVRAQINRPAAAKTGTTQEFKDAWFVGFVPQLVTGVWVGNDNNATMEGVAEVAVCPRIWKDFNLAALKNLPAQSFPEPYGLVKIKICKDSGKLPGIDCPENRIIWESFWEKSTPNDICDYHSYTEIEGTPIKKEGLVPYYEIDLRNPYEKDQN